MEKNAETPVRHRHISLRTRVMVFLAAFVASLLMQQYLGFVQSNYILGRMDRQTGNFHAISQFLSGVEATGSALDAYGWAYDDAAELSAALDRNLYVCDNWLAHIESDLAVVSEGEYLLASAAKTTYQTYTGLVNRILEKTTAGDNEAAAALYYASAQPCGDYLRQYTQELLETAITNGQSSYAELSRLSALLKNLQMGITALCLVLGFVALRSVLRILTPVQEMIQASQILSTGDYSAPDVPVRRQDEIGRLAGSFNRMKHSMAEQVKTLQEKNEMESALFKKENEALELQNLMERETLQQLRSQIDPHFLFNTLNVILHTAEQESAYRTGALLTALSHLLRYSLASNDVQVPLSREVRIVDEYFSLYHIRFGDRVKFEWRIADSIDLTETMVPSFILQPLVENAFKHGISPKEEGGRVRIRINRLPKKGLLYISVSDDGVGMDKAELDHLRQRLQNPPTDGQHIGVYNVAARLRLIDPRCRFDIHSRAGRGTCAVMYLPLIEPPEEEPPEEQGGESTHDQPVNCG